MKPTSIGRALLVTLAFSPPAFIGLLSAPAADPGFCPQERSHWALQNLTPSKPPKVDQTDWVRNPTAAFILGRWEGKGLKPAPPADRATWIHRATFDRT